MLWTNCLINFLKRHNFFNDFLYNWRYKKSGWKGYGKGYKERFYPNKYKIFN